MTRNLAVIIRNQVSTWLQSYRKDCNLAEARLRELLARPFHKYSRPSRTDMRGVRRASVSEEGGPWGKHGFPHGASAPEAREAA
jgi:hypothetical protein